MTIPAATMIAVLGESQVGKSSLVNAVVGADLMPTAGVGRPRSQTVCEFSLDDLPVSEEQHWCFEVDWVSPDVLVEILSSPPTGRRSARALLFHEGIIHLAGQDVTLAIDALRSIKHASEIPDRLALGRDLRWLRLNAPSTRDQAKRQLDVLAGGWAAALTTGVRLLGAAPHQYGVVDLPGVGGQLDAGGEATSSWLDQHAASVAAIVCVIGQNGLGNALSTLLLERWKPVDLWKRLHVVTTYADESVDDRDNALQREAASGARRMRAMDQLARLLGLSDGGDSLASRIYCIDPRRGGKWTFPVDFKGELERLRAALKSSRDPCRLAAAPDIANP